MCIRDRSISINYDSRHAASRSGKPIARTVVVILTTRTIQRHSESPTNQRSSSDFVMADNDPSPRSQPATQTATTTNNDASSVRTADIPTPDELPPNAYPSIRSADTGADNLAPLRPGYVRAFTSDSAGPRRTSVQFVPQTKIDSNDERSRSRRPAREVSGRRLSSPPPPK